jgi:putative NIF3 family GTP cyclohydrolase 1 type 2
MPACEVLARVVATLERIAPTRFAGSWDNVGLLVDAVRPFAAVAAGSGPAAARP